MRNKPVRNRKLEVRLSDAEYETIRKKFGRKAAEVARLFLLGHRVSLPSQNQKNLGLILRALAIHRMQVLEMRILIKKSHGSKAAEILEREDQLFNSIIQICTSNFSEKNKAA